MASNFAQIWSEIQEKHKFGTKVPFLTFPQIFQRGGFFGDISTYLEQENIGEKTFAILSRFATFLS